MKNRNSKLNTTIEGKFSLKFSYSLRKPRNCKSSFKLLLKSDTIKICGV